MNGIHSCNYYCDRAPCIKAQRDEMRDALFDQHTVAALRQKLADAELALAKSIALDAESEARIANERNHAMSQAYDEARDQFQRAEAENAALREWKRDASDLCGKGPDIIVAREKTK